ncbi:MAG: CCA tRNA nucleotidyltransferase [Chitinispirillaceae bacterium]|nr:CCA tRNA nucleotidyltransferase [Chitinispirillaceae bacterium]
MSNKKSGILNEMEKTTSEKNKKFKAAMKIVNRLTTTGYEALFAGGWVRDKILGKETDSDIDIATNALPEEIQKLFPHTIPVGAHFGVVIVVEEGIPFEVATFRSDIGISDGRHPSEVQFTDVYNDAIRRDFTINGIFFDPLSSKFLDYVGGREDISRGIIRAIGEPELRFKEDYLRMLRAIRFAARLDFTIEKETWEAIVKMAPEIRKISVERIFTELDKMFCSKNAALALDLLDKSGLLPVVLPEVAALKGVPQPPEFHPEGDVFEHTKKALSLLGDSTSSALAWSVLLHDIGKAQTISIVDRIRFNNHDQVGMEIAERILRRLHTSNELIEQVKMCVGNHMNFIQVKKMRLSNLKKFLARPTIDIELELHRIDCLASHGDLDNYEFLKKQQEIFKAEALKPKPLLRGQDLLDLGFKQGPIIGEILSSVYDLQLEEVIKTKEEAIKYVKENYLK